jgi:hypothetical protein
VDRGLFGLLGYDCRRLKLEKVSQGCFWGQFWIPVRKSRAKRLAEPHLPSFANSTSSYASTYRSVKHSFNSCLPQDVVLEYTQYCTSNGSRLTLLYGFKGPKGRQHKSWESTFVAPREHATHHTTLPDTFPEQRIVHARRRDQARYGSCIQGYDSWFAGPAQLKALTARPV